jgi:hypothetical protein
MSASSEMIAGDRVADRQREEAERNGDHDHVEHQTLPAMCCVMNKVPLLRSSILRKINVLRRIFPVKRQLGAIQHISFREEFAGEVIGIS